MIKSFRHAGLEESMFNPPHPGSVVKDALPEIPMTVTDFAAHIGVSRITLSRVLNGRAGITPEMSIKISQAFGQSPGDLWFRMQNAYDFWHASRAKRKAVRPLQFKSQEDTGHKPARSLKPAA